MKKLKLFTVLLTVALIAGVGIFYACDKNEKDNVDKSSETLKKEYTLTSRINSLETATFQVVISENNVIDIKRSINKISKSADFEMNTYILFEDVNLEPTEESTIVYLNAGENYWIVPFDEEPPMKVGEGGGSYLEMKCDCKDKENEKCKVSSTKNSDGSVTSTCVSGDCTTCCLMTVIYKKSATSSALVIQADKITVNGILYE